MDYDQGGTRGSAMARVDRNDGRGAAGPANNFVSPETALSFPVASGAITAAWKISGLLWTPLGASVWVPVIMSAIVGLAFYLVSDVKGRTWRQRIPILVAAVFNTLTLAAAVLGLNQLIAPH